MAASTKCGYYDSGALQYEEHFLNGKLHGTCKGYYRDGKPDYEDIFVNGSLKNRKIYYPSGNIQSEYNYNEKGLINGKCTSYYDSGGDSKHIEAHYKNGRLHGPFHLYSKAGNLLQTIMHAKGKEEL